MISKEKLLKNSLIEGGEFMQVRNVDTMIYNAMDNYAKMFAHWIIINDWEPITGKRKARWGKWNHLAGYRNDPDAILVTTEELFIKFEEDCKIKKNNYDENRGEGTDELK